MNPHLKPVLKLIRKELEAISSSFYFGSELAGMCALSAGRVNDVLSTFINRPLIMVNEIESTEFHVFNVIDSLVIDLTATQFGIRNGVFIEDINTEWPDKDQYWFKKNYQFENFDELNEWAIDTGWALDDLYTEEMSTKIGAICIQNGVKLAEEYLLKNKLATALNTTSINFKDLKHQEKMNRN